MDDVDPYFCVRLEAQTISYIFIAHLNILRTVEVKNVIAFNLVFVTPIAHY